MEKQDGTEVSAALLTATLLLVMVAVAALIPADPAYLHARFTAEHVQQLGMYDSRGQQWAHRAALILVGILGAGLWLLRPVALPRVSSRAVSRSGEFLSRYGGALIIALVAALVMLRSGNPPETIWAFQGRYALRPVLSTFAHGLLLVLGIAATWLSLVLRHRTTSAMQYLVFAALGTYVLALLYLGIAPRPDLSQFSPGLLAGVEAHYSGGVAPADLVAAGRRLDEVSIYYGILPAALLGMWQQTFGVLDFGGHIRLIAVLQGLALVAVLAGYGAWYSWRAAPWIVAGLLVLPWMQPLHVALLYPNQSAWRFLAFCLGTVVLAALYARPAKVAAPVLGFLAGAALLWNTETGICLSAAYVLFLVLRDSWAPITRFFAGVLAAVAAFWLAVRAGLGYWPDAAALLKSSPLIGDFAKGYAGVRLGQLEPLAVLVFVHALFVLIRGLLDWGSGARLEPREHCRITLAALLVLWAAYYFNRPDPWNLWSFLVVYGFLVGDLLREGGRLLAAPRPGALAVIVLPSILAMNGLTLLALDLAARDTGCAPDEVISGACVPRPAAKRLAQKAESLREESGRRSVVYFTADAYLMPLMTGIDQPRLPRDPYSESITKADFDRLVARIRELQPACALFDDPKSPLSGSRYHRSFYARVQSAIAPLYQREQSSGGWEAWCLKPG